MTMPLRYEAYEDTVDRPNVVVDGSPNEGTVLALSHWPGIPAPAGTEADLSAQMAFRYLDLGADRHGQAEIVTNNHVDQDGLVAVHALVDPEHALAHRELLEDLAAAGDFGTYRYRDAARLSMAISAYADGGRSPLGALADAELYRELLGRLPGLVEAPDRVKELWADEDRELDESEAALADGTVSLVEHAEVDLAVVDVTAAARRWSGHRFRHQRFEGIHPMALNNATACVGVLVVAGRRYTYTDRYETWVQYRSRPVRRRVDLAPLADELMAAEPGGARWKAGAPGDLAPELHLVDGDESGLDPDEVVGRLRHHLATAPPAWDPYTA